MILLPNGCSCSKMSVFPKNWQTKSASIAINWRFHYYFHDPNFSDNPKLKYGKLVIVKGMNCYKQINERRAATKLLMDYEMQRLQVEGFNPITGINMPDMEIENEYEISPRTGFFDALQKAWQQLSPTGGTAADMKSMMGRVGKAITQLNLQSIPIDQISRKHITYILEHITKTHKRFSGHQFNKYRSYLMSLFKVLYRVEAVNYNPIRDIEKRKITVKLREVLSPEDRFRIAEHLSANYPSFWTFTQIFFHSGGREIELLNLQVKDVNLGKQVYKSMVKKGRQYTEVERTIKDVALPLWTVLIASAKPDDYIFSAGLVPGPKTIRREQITRRWSVHVKKKLGITADFYSLKHLNLDETAALLNAKDAARQAGHTTPVVTLSHYLVGEKERQHNRLKGVDNAF